MKTRTDNLCPFVYNEGMQQYFADRDLNTGEIIDLEKDVLYHLIRVLRKDGNYTFRIADREGKIFHAHVINI